MRLQCYEISTLRLPANGHWIDIVTYKSLSSPNASQEWQIRCTYTSDFLGRSCFWRWPEQRHFLPWACNIFIICCSGSATILSATGSRTLSRLYCSLCELVDLLKCTCHTFPDCDRYLLKYAIDTWIGLFQKVVTFWPIRQLTISTVEFWLRISRKDKSWWKNAPPILYTQ